MSITVYAPKQGAWNRNAGHNVGLAVEGPMKKVPTILIVQSDNTVSEVVAKTLHREFQERGRACSTEFTNSGIEALERLKRGGVDLVVTGILIYGIPGQELIRRAREAGIAVKIAVYSSEVARSHDGQIGALGCDWAFEKPGDNRGMASKLFELATE